MLKRLVLLSIFLISLNFTISADDTGINLNTASQWQQTLDRVSNGIVSIRVDGTRAFDTDWNQSTQATGFIVDKERGIILTNRHVVMGGPEIAEGVFLNNEEIELKPIYRDPVHDFGFFQYDPSKLKFIQPVELPLRPQNAVKSLDIRVVGNDAGEQLAILAGTLAKLDRDAPEYGRASYNDFNTFYYQAASSTSGGSSGSPVLDINGNVIALNAGASNKAASSFFLPLNRVVRALKLIQKDLPVTRGSIQTVFKHKSYDELRRLGLTEAIEREARTKFPDSKGLLVVDQVLPKSPASAALDPGDIVTHINGKLFADFITLEALIDESVGKEINFSVQRGKENFNANISVHDLHKLSASEYLEIGNGVVHTLSYQVAKNFNVPVEGLFIANPGYMFGNGGIPRGAVVKQVNGKPVKNLEDFAKIISNLSDKEKLTIRYFTGSNTSILETRIVYMEYQWFPVQRCVRDDSLGAWPCEKITGNDSVAEQEISSTSFVFNGNALANKLAPSLVMVNYEAPYFIKGISQTNYYGAGLIINAKKGYVLVDRNTVPLSMGDVRLTFAGSLEVFGKVEYVHPIHNLAVVSYDPKLIGNTPVKNVNFDATPLKSGDEVTVVGLQADHKLLSQKTSVASIDAFNAPLSSYFGYRDINTEVISLVNPPESIDGLIVDAKGKVRAKWGSYSYSGGAQVSKGIPAEYLIETSEQVDLRDYRSAEIEFSTLTLASARKRGLPNDWAKRLEKHDPLRRKVLEVERTVSGSPAQDLVISGDLLLAVDGNPVSTFRDVEKAMQKNEAHLSLWRDSELIEVVVPTVTLQGETIDRILVWSGAYLHAPHRDLLAQRTMQTDGVYVSYYSFGSPATRYGLWAGQRITEIDGQIISNIDDLIKLVKNKKHRESVRIKTLAWNNQARVITLKVDSEFWPFYELLKTESGWIRKEL